MVGEILDGVRVIALDLETTGISTRNDRIVQFALIGSQANGEKIQWCELVNPERRIPIEAMRVHKITDEDVRNEPVFSTYADKLSQMIDGAVIVGHNVRQFDLGMLNQEFLRCGKLPPKPKAILDTLEIVRKLKLPRSHRLGELCRKHGIDLQNAHDAAADAAASLLLLWKIMQNHPAAFRKPLNELEEWIVSKSRPAQENQLGKGLNDLEPVDAIGRIRIDDEGNMILAFGRHRSKTIAQVERDDPSYMQWILSGQGVKDETARKRIIEHLSSIRNW